MKRYILILLLITKFSTAQTVDYSKKNKEELISIIDSKVNEIKVLENMLKSSKIEIEKLVKDKLEIKENNSYQLEIAILKKSIKETNSIILRELFDDKYIKEPCLIKTDLAKDDITSRIKNSNILITSIRLDETNKDVFYICEQALDFNLNYLKLFEIRKSVLSQKYDSLKVKKALKDIDSLPNLILNSKLDITKKRISILLQSYLENNCSLKEKLDRYKLGGNTESMKVKYTALEKDDQFKDYPYLVQIIQKIKNNPDDYSNDDLQSCYENKEVEIKK
jgi:hypothetical protein